MDEAQFWKLIEEARQEADGECDTQAEILIQKLLAYKPEELIAFDDIMFDLRIKAYRGDLWGAAYLINGGCSDDGFEYFRCWLIGQGEKIYYDALRDPETLADLPNLPDDAECEDLLYAVDRAYEKLTDEELRSLVGRAWPEITFDWTEENVDEKYPRLSARVEAMLGESEEEGKEEEGEEEEDESQ